MDKLRSWTDDPATQHFSGVAVYEKLFTVPESLLKANVRLSFGTSKPAAAPAGRNQRQQALLEAPVREAAVVYINDQRAGVVWCPPYSIDISPLPRRPVVIT